MQVKKLKKNKKTKVQKQQTITDKASLVWYFAPIPKEDSLINNLNNSADPLTGR
ncbi:hypothetical protein [Chitinophaga oryziterrae]|nr:hypothetical protein [Chitinophaga oryziterrae]